MAGQYPFAGGPYLGAAVLCERVLQEMDGTKSAIRIIDRITRQMPAMEMEPFEFEMFLLIRFKSGSARGPMTLEIRMLKPSGESTAPVRSSLPFEGEDDRGVDIVIGLKTKFEHAGVYWYVISLDNSEVTRIPLRVVYIPQIMQMTPGGGSQPPAGSG